MMHLVIDMQSFRLWETFKFVHPPRTGALEKEGTGF